MLDSILSALKAISLEPIDAVMIPVGVVLIFAFQELLRHFVFKPVLAHIEERESLTTGAVHTAAQMRQKSAALKARYEEGIFAARVEGNSKRAAILNSAKSEASEIVKAAEQDAAKRVQVGREEIANQVAKAKVGAEAAAADLAKALASRVDSQLAN
jgi:F-type H+-transporting ATPase subunit b